MTRDDGFGRSIVRGAGFACGFGLVAGLVLIGAAAINVLVLIFVAVILASGLQPVIAWIRSRRRIGHGPAILLVYGAFFAVVVGMAVAVVPVAISQLDRTMASLPPFLDRAREWAAGVDPPVLSRTLAAIIDAAARAVAAAPAAAPAPGQVVEVGMTVVGTVMSVLTLLTVVYFWLTEHARLQRYALAFVPARRRTRVHRIWNSAETRLGQWVRGELILMTTIGLGTATAYTLLGVPAALLLGLIAALAEAIPIVGPLLGAIPAVLVAMTVSPELALAVAVVYLLLQLVEGNILVPLVMRNTTGVSPFLVILSVLIGAAAGGFAGALLAVPIAAAGEVLIEGFQARETPVAQDPSAAGTTDDEANPPDTPDPAPDASRARGATRSPGPARPLANARSPRAAPSRSDG